MWEGQRRPQDGETGWCGVERQGWLLVKGECGTRADKSVLFRQLIIVLREGRGVTMTRMGWKARVDCAREERDFTGADQC